MIYVLLTLDIKKKKRQCEKKSMFIYGRNDLCVDNEEVALWLLHDRLLLVLLSRFIRARLCATP